MLRTFCVERERDWDEEIPLLLFAVRNTTQASLGFSPSELIFGHSVRGPLKVLQGQILGDEHSSHPKNVSDYVSSFRERLHSVWTLARKSLCAAQERMKICYDHEAVLRSFQIGDRVLVLLPIPGSPLRAKFVGPYKIQARLGETDYVVNTFNRRRKSRVCHVNMLKPYVTRSDVSNVAAVAATVTSVNMSLSDYIPLRVMI